MVKCCIRTTRHKDHFEGLPVWWGPDHSGYITNPDRAGRYGYDEAKKISDGVHGKDYPVKESSMHRHKKNYMDMLRRRARIAFDGATDDQIRKISEEFRK